MTDLARIVERFEDATVRDLAWLLFTPDLLCAAHVDATLAHPFENEAAHDAALDWLLALDARPGALHAHARNPKHTRLGKYAESLLEFFLAHGPTLRLIAANVPLRQGRRTIGECDFLLETASGARLHWELAVKFYLHIGDGRANVARLSDYVGPNLQDRFDLKVSRLLTHQLGLTARAEFAGLGLPGPWQPEAYIKGRLFYHGHGNDASPAPELGAQHLRGWWLTASEWNASRDALTHGRAWIVQPRMAWLASRRIGTNEAASLQADETAIRTRLQTTTAPTMLAVYAPGNGDAWFEESRGFIVPDAWPEHARAFASKPL